MKNTLLMLAGSTLVFGLTLPAQAQTPFKTVGEYNWWVDGKAGPATILKADGTAVNGGRTGQWSEAKPVRRLITIRWTQGNYTDDLLVQPDGTISGTNNEKSKIRGVLVSPGQYRWSVDGKPGPDCFLKADGTSENGGRTGKWREDVKPQSPVVIQWQPGNFTDTLNWTPDGKSLRGTNNMNSPVRGDIRP